MTTTTDLDRVAFSPAELAAKIGKSTDTVRRRIRDGSIRASMLGGSVLISAAEVARIIGEDGDR